MFSSYHWCCLHKVLTCKPVSCKHADCAIHTAEQNGCKIMFEEQTSCRWGSRGMCSLNGLKMATSVAGPDLYAAVPAPCHKHGTSCSSHKANFVYLMSTSCVAASLVATVTHSCHYCRAGKCMSVAVGDMPCFRKCSKQEPALWLSLTGLALSTCPNAQPVA